MSSEHRQVTVANEPIEYHVRRSSNATEPRIDVGIHEITVVLPEGVSADPEQLLLENGHWVVAKKRKFDRYREQVPERKFEEGTTFPFLGEPHEIVVEVRSAAEIVDRTIRLAEHNVERTSLKRALETFYRRKAREQFEEYAGHYAAEMGVEYDRIEVRNQRTKWGSCSTNGTIGLNWRLMMAPPEIVEYVVIHELAHIQEPNHSEAFWSLVERYDPEYRAHKNWLAENSTRLVFCSDDV
ncbi:putative metal-dependent hydrolase [Halalkaliarchaeum sp. AArc-CO]|uniref:M48 family metallopeptidase n=1 Tax=Halalkaliarchaeum sp. AArc-CO TaxID=2866381 RepID=UPI00217E996B|nr:SprT family zinc-dependent metalloprotease [Halalkaliarchaeum sp. AArc-CO]UWG50710.1 putative metal-dependent hydrolase [Halalkaliarchaeum sp. AArc-CO]